MPSVPVKLYKENEIRRLHLESNEDGRFSYQNLISQVQGIFPNVNGAKLMWKDNDGDLIMMSSSVELMEAIRNMTAESPVLRIHVIETSTNNMDAQEIPAQQQIVQEQEQQMKTDEQEPINEDPNLHRNVYCDGCEGEIRGIRHKCLTCPDYDLCSNCVGKHDEHPMIRITVPDDKTWKPAFIASQGYAGFFHGKRGCGSGRCHRRRHCHAPWTLLEPAQYEEQTTEQPTDTNEKPNEPEPQVVIDEFTRNLTETISNVLNAIGIQTQASTPAPTAPEQGMAAASAPQAGAMHPDAKVAAALNYMLAMGYSNDGGWLTKLLEEKRGDVSAVLDVLHPTQN